MRLSLIALVFSTACTVVLAQSYPAKPVRMIVAYPAGGSVDVVARIVGQKFTESMGRSFVIENRPGAGGNIGTDYAAKAPNDGYVLLMGSAAAIASNPPRRCSKRRPYAKQSRCSRRPRKAKT